MRRSYKRMTPATDSDPRSIEEAARASILNDQDKRDIVERVILSLRQSEELALPSERSHTPTRPRPPWLLEQFFAGELDLEEELAERFQNMPVMATIKVRPLGSNDHRSMALLTAQDGSAQLIMEADHETRIVHMSFILGAMLTLRFVLTGLNSMDRARWLASMRREKGGMTFLWGPDRWERDYLICVSRKYFTNFYAFSSQRFQAAVRMTPDVTQQVLGWLESFWEDMPPDDPDSELLTW